MTAPEREAMIQRYRHLVKATRVRLVPEVPPPLEAADLESAGLIALCEAVDQFDPTRGVQFETYAIAKIRGAIKECLRQEDWAPRSVREKQRRGEAVAIVRQVSLDALATDAEGGREEWLPDPTPSASETVPARWEAEVVHWAASCLPVRLRAVIQARYQQGHSQAEVARRLGVKPRHVAQIEAEARQRVRRFLAHLGGQEWRA